MLIYYGRLLRKENKEGW